MIKLLVAAALALPLAAADHAAWLAKLEGLYMGENLPTPFGRIGFAMDMVRQPDGAMHGRVQTDKETYFEFKFWLNPRGEILFRETGALPGGFVQSYELELVKAEGDTLTFETKKSPGVLTAHVTADGNRLHVNTIVRGKAHADLDMARVRDKKTIAAFRADQVLAKDRPAGSVQQLLAGQAAAKVDAKLSKSEQARQHVAEAQKLGSEIASADPSQIPGLAFRMKGHLDQAVELDPGFDGAHFALAGWYLRAPELAGGSKTKAQEILGTLEKLNSPLAEKLRAQLSR